MILGLISDIHGNLPALTAVLQALTEKRADLILCAGDLVCYGAQPNEVVAMLRQASIPCVAGNYDAAVAWDLPTAARKASSPHTEPLKQAALDWTKQKIDSQHRAYLRGLPWSMNFHLDGHRIHLLHAGPSYLDEWLTPEQPLDLSNLAASLDADVVVLGHTHQAFIYDLQDAHGKRTRFINPGAVGRSLDADTRAAYALLDTTTNHAELCRVDYDQALAMESILHSGMPLGIGLMMQHGARRLEQLSPAILAPYGIEIL